MLALSAIVCVRHITHLSGSAGEAPNLCTQDTLGDPGTGAGGLRVTTDMANHGTGSFSGKRALVSGGTTGIGRAIVEMLLAEGAQVATFARTEEDVQELRRSLPDVKAFAADMTDREQVVSVVQETLSAFGGLDLLVNNAAVGGQSITDQDYEEWKSIVEINLIGPMMLTQVVAEHLQPGAHIVTVGSMSAKVREEGSDVYVATKSGIRGFVDSLGRTLNQKGILLSLIEPGLADSDMTTVDDGKSREEAEKMKAEHKMMEPEDVARAVLFVASQPPHMVIPELQIRPRAQLI
ncbi:SDR family oxidoreductase [bacterium]|nr:MAG: SDR family oxidoreductase [bacterium]